MVEANAEKRNQEFKNREWILPPTAARDISVDEVPLSKNLLQQTTQPQQQQDGLDLILDDHKKVRTLIRDQFLKVDNNCSEQRSIMKLVVKLLCAHSQIEERLVYPLIKFCALHDAEGLMNGSIADHQDLEEDLDNLLDEDLSDEQFLETANVMIKDLEDHLKREETEIIPQLKQRMSSEQLQILAQLILEAKKVAPDMPYVTEDMWWTQEPICTLNKKLCESFKSDDTSITNI